MRRFVIVAVLSFGTFPAFADVEADLSRCKTEADSLKRLTCYDAIDTSIATGKVAAPDGDGNRSAGQIELVNVALRVQEKDFDKQVFNRRVELQPTFKNASGKTLVAVEHTLQIKDAFGVLIIDGTSQLDIKIAPGGTAESDSFYFWQDNPFISNEPFDKLQGPVSTGVAKAILRVTKAVFADGSIESY